MSLYGGVVGIYFFFFLGLGGAAVRLLNASTMKWRFGGPLPEIQKKRKF